MRRLTIIGCGKVGKTLGYLLANAGCYQIQDVVCSNDQSAKECIQFLGSGHAVADFSELRATDVMLISVKDDQLLPVVEQLEQSTRITPDIVFHCSGAYSHSILMPLKRNGTQLASLHPVKSFSDPSSDIHQFSGTYCTLEGDLPACEELAESFKKIGANLVKIKSEFKLLYHIATIFSSNFLVALVDTSLNLLEKNNLKSDQGLALLEPLLLGAFQQIKTKGTQTALTGPIARGDATLVKQQYNALLALDKDVALAYKALGKLTLEIAKKKGSLDNTAIQELDELFG
jgi:predicted short-subunit dehydrogenase-like oxidoreductase (DUF2520 family)